jgi:hypothetical protein
MVSGNLDGFAVLNRSDGSIVKGDYKDNDFIRNNNYSDSREEMQAKAEAEQKRSVVQQNGSKNNKSSDTKNGFDYSVFKPWDRVPVRPETYDLWVSMLTERNFLEKYNIVENPTIANIKNCMAKFNYAINNIPAEFVDDVAEDLQKMIKAALGGQFDQYLGNTSRSSSSPVSKASNCSTGSRDYVFVCDDCGKMLIQQSTPYDDSFCPETRWGGVGKVGTVWDKGDHNYTKIGQSGACSYTCTRCKISIRIGGEPSSNGVCGASGSNCCNHYWEKK